MEEFSLFPTQPYVYTRDDAEKVKQIVLSGNLTHVKGEEIRRFEAEFSKYIGTQYALTTNSGTSALTLACKAIGLTPGDEVIVPAYTFIASAQAVLANGGIPVFADIDDTFSISPEHIKRLIHKRTKAIMVVHMFGNVADMGAIMRLAKQYNLKVIEDCAQAAGARYGTKRVGSIGDIGCFSFNEKKALPTGQGGMVTTSNKRYWQIAAAARDAGIVWANKHMDVTTIGNTYFMTEMQATLGRGILSNLDVLNARRRDNFVLFCQKAAEFSEYLTCYRIVPSAGPSYSRLVFVLHADHLGMTRDEFIRSMRNEGIPLQTFYPIPLYAFSLFQKQMDLLTANRFPFENNKHIRYASIKLPYVEQFCQDQVGMEFSPYIREEDINHFVSALKKVIHSNQSYAKH